jgi:hypothetical protein
VSLEECIMTLKGNRSLTVCAVLCALAAATPAAQKPQLPDLLKKTADYLAGYSKTLTGINAEEDYTQRDVTVSVSGEYRHLKSDMTFIGLGDGTIASFRDVFEADGKSTREHGTSRLGALLATPTQAAVNSAQELTGASTNYFLDMLRPAIDRPTLALEYVRADNQGKSDFKIDGTKKTNGVDVAILHFTERRPAGGQGVAVPTVLDLPNKATASGRITVEVATGAVRQTELLIEGGGNMAVHARILVTYDTPPKMNVLLPVSMDQTYDMTSGGSGESTTMDSCGSGSCGVRRNFDCHTKYAKFTPIAGGTGGDR